MNKTKVHLQDGSFHEILLDADLLATVALLPREPATCFVGTDDALYLPLSNIILSRARSEGIKNAAKLMVAAARGEIPGRFPVTVKPINDICYVVIDGNSTVIVAKISGWLSIPCKLLVAEEV